MKRFLSVVLCFVFVLLSVPFSALNTAADTYGDFEYSVSGGKATITGYTGSGGDVTIPSHIGGYAVTSIGDNAFDGCTSLTSITIPGSVTSISRYAFVGCESIEKIVVDRSNTVYHSSGNCLIKTESKMLVVGCENSVIPSDGSVDYIDCNAFANRTGLKTIVIPNGVSTIQGGAFRGCTSLTSVSIPASVTSIGAYYYEAPFAGCDSLTSITVDADNPVFHSRGNCIINDEGRLVVGCKNSVIPSDGSVTGIGYVAFAGCTGLRSITIPDSVTYIYDDAFSSCTNLTSITIPDSVTSIGEFAFYDCPSLTTVYYTGTEEQWAAIEKEEGNDCLTNATIVYNYNSGPVDDDFRFEIENDKATITKYTGDGGDVVIPSQIDGYAVTSIGEGAFEDCSSLASVTIPDSVTIICDWAFEGCTSLTSVTISNSVTSIGGYAFYGCTSLTSITIPDSVTRIDYLAFCGCNSLASITVDKSNPVYHSSGNCLIETASKTLIAGCKSSVIPSDGSVTSIGDYAFADCESLLSITIPDSVKYIGYSVFAGTTYFNNKNNWIDGVLYNGNYLIAAVDINGSYAIKTGTKCIAENAFHYCTSLTCITIPDSVISIGKTPFSYCTSLASLTVDANNPVYHSSGNCIIETANKTLVAGCKNSVIPSDGSVTSIGGGAFHGCESLTSVTIPNGVTNICETAFHDCASLTTVYYTGTEEQWAAIQIGAYNEPLTNATIVYNYNPGSIDGTFNYLSTFTENNEVYDFYYEDAFFDHSAYEYDHQLARVSMCAAFASYGYYENVNHKGSENIKDLFIKIGIDEEKIFDHYKKPTGDANSIGFVIGSKSITCTDGEYSLIVITIRGGGYKDEWISNFTMGEIGDHEGFSAAANVVKDGIKNYINDSKYDLLPNKKVWIQGYSRAGAVTNLTAAYLDNEVAQGGIQGLALKDIYAYGFEVPQGRGEVYGPAAEDIATRYNNIFSIVNPNDLIPKVAQSKYGFSRYGITLELPTKRNIFMLSMDFDMYDNYYLPAMRSEYTKILKRLSTREFDNYKYYSEPRQPELYDILINGLTEAIGSREDYVELQHDISHMACYSMYDDYASKVYPMVVEIEDKFYHRDVLYTTEDANHDGIPDNTSNTDWKRIITKLPFSDYTSIEIRMGLYHISLTVDQFKTILSALSDYYYWATDIPAGINAISMMIIKLLSIFGITDFDTATDNLLKELSLSNIADSHYAELCLAWMNATNDLVTAYKTRYLYIHCPVDVNVYDGNGKLVASVENDAVKKQGEGPVQAYVDAVGTKIFLLPDSEEYRVEVTATDSGEVDYSVAEYDHSAGMFTRYVDYKGITVNKGDNLNGKIDDLDKVAAPEYELRNTADKPIAAANDVQGAEANALALEDHSSLDRDISEFLDFFVPGDVNGNGKIDSKDYAMTKRAFLKTYTLTDEQLLRADVNNNGKVDSKDYAMIKRHFLKTYVIPGAEGA